MNVFEIMRRFNLNNIFIFQEVHNTVFMSQELAKRCIWLNRLYTPSPKTPDNVSPGDVELDRRLTNLQRDLRVS